MEGAIQVIEADGGVTVLALRGELDIARTPPMSVAINEILRARPVGVVIDLCAVSFADSTGLALLLNAHRRAVHQGTPLCLACDVGQTLQLLGLTRLDREFELHRSRAEAVEALAARPAQSGA